MGNDEWGMGNDEWGMVIGEWGMVNAKCVRLPPSKIVGEWGMRKQYYRDDTKSSSNLCELKCEKTFQTTKLCLICIVINTKTDFNSS